MLRCLRQVRQPQRIDVAGLEPSPAGLVVRDLGSSNGTFVNGERIHAATTLAAGDEIVLGSTRVIVEPDAVRAPRSGAAPDLHATVGPGEVRQGELTQSLATLVSSLGADPRASLAASVIGGILTIVFSDIVDSTVQNAALGDHDWLTLLRRHNRIVKDHLQRYGGVEVKGQGDGYLLTFPSPADGVRFAGDVQRAFARERANDPTFGLRVRLGVHTGEVLQVAGDIFGQHVNYAARVAAQAGGDEVLVSQRVFELTSASGLVFGPSRSADLKGFEGAHEVYSLVWDGPWDR